MRQGGRLFCVVAIAAALCLIGIFVSVSAASSSGKVHCAGRHVTVGAAGPGRTTYGTKRADVIDGTKRTDRIRARRGADRICGRRGADRVRGGRGRDSIRGGAGRDRIRGGKGRDQIRGGKGRDHIKGGAGRDVIRTRDGVRDRIDCGRGTDTAIVDRKDTVRRCERVRGGGAPTGNAGAMPNFSLPPWSDALWSDPSNYTTIHASDIDGDGKDELIGRGPAGIEAYKFDPTTGNWLPLYNGEAPGLSDATGWDQPAYYSTIQLGGVANNGRDELLARGADGLHAWAFSGRSPSCSATQTSGCWSQLPTLTSLSDACCNAPDYYSTIQIARWPAGDLVWARMPEGSQPRSGGMQAWRLDSGNWTLYSRGEGPFNDNEANGQYPDGYWRHPQYYSTIQNANVTGNNYPELLGRSPDGLVAYGLNGFTGDWDQVNDASQGTNVPLTLDALSDGNGWNQPQYYSTIQTGNIDGGGQQEVLARGPNGIREWTLTCKTWTGGFLHLTCATGTWTELPPLGQFTDAAGWDKPQYYSTIQTADINGDGRDEVLGRGPNGVEAWEFTAGAWKQVTAGDGPFTDAAGWNEPRYYSTIQTAHLGPGPTRDLIGRGLTGVETQSLDSAKQSLVDTSVAFPDLSSGQQAIAYKAINAYIGGQDNPNFDLRQAYPDALGSQLSAWKGELGQVPQPSGVTDDIWNAVKAQLSTELSNGILVQSWFGPTSTGSYLHTQVADKFLALSMDTSAEVLKFDTQKNANLVMDEWNTFEGVVEGLGGLGAISGPLGGAAVVAASVVGAAATAGVGEPNVQAAIDSVEGNYIQLRNRLNADFQDAVKGIGLANEGIQSDYGLQSAVAGLINSATWSPMTPDVQATALATAERNYDVSAWQTITPGIWNAIRFAPDLYKSWCEGGAHLYPKGYCEYKDSSGAGWTLAHNACDMTGGPTPSGGGCGPVDLATVGTLTDATSKDCLQTWNLSTCSMGVPLIDVLNGVNGWQNLPLWMCDKRSPILGGIKCTKARP